MSAAMKRTLLYIIAAFAAVSLCGCGGQKVDEGPARVIFETDLGNDVDDVLAMDMLYKYADQGKIDLLAVMLNKVEHGALEFADVLREWYGYPDLPIGNIKEGADCSTDSKNYAEHVSQLKDSTGAPLFKGTGKDLSQTPLAVDLYRQILAEQPDASVTIVSVGFSTNLARLLDTPADEYSDLTGRELVARKVKALVTMAGCLLNDHTPEYNVMKDVPSAKKVFAEWPGKIVTSPFELGREIVYPASSIENDFGWAPLHPLVEAYKCYRPMPYDQMTWDLTSVLYGVEGDKDGSYFKVEGPGRIEVTDGAGMVYTADPKGDRYYLVADGPQGTNILNRFKELITSKPASFKAE